MHLEANKAEKYYIFPPRRPCVEKCIYIHANGAPVGLPRRWKLFKIIIFNLICRLASNVDQLVAVVKYLISIPATCALQLILISCLLNG